MPTSSGSGQLRGLEALIAWSGRHRFALDVLWAVFWLALCLLVNASVWDSPWGTVAFVAVTVTTCAALAVRRVLPLIAVLTWLVAMISHILLAHSSKPLPLDWASLTSIVATLGAAFTVQSELRAPLRRFFVIPLALGPVAAAMMSSSGTPADLVGRAIGVVMAWSMIALFSVLGILARVRRQELDRAVAHATLLQAQQDQEIELATLDERTRLAREMHDTVAHSLGVVIAQADGGRYAVLADPRAGKESLDAIAKVARESLAEMRRLVGTLRNEDRDLAAAPKASDIPSLVEDFRGAGLWIRYQASGSGPAELAPTLSLTIYRLVQQSLSNALKHGTTRPSAHLVIDWTDELFVLDVTNPLPPARQAPDEAPGHGLIGMLERARMLGGTLTAGPVGGDGPPQWRVRAALPVKTAEVPVVGVHPAEENAPRTVATDDTAPSTTTTSPSEGRTDDRP